MSTYHEFHSSRREVAVLGSSKLGEDHAWWHSARDLGRLLAIAHCTVVTGGYGGLMAAVSQGAQQAGGRVVGLPMRTWHALTPNKWNDELRWADDYGARLAHILTCDAVIALPGGVGTLSEMFVVWATIQTESQAPVLVVLGEGWEPLLEAARTHFFIRETDTALIHMASNPEDALRIVQHKLMTGERPSGTGPTG